MDVKNKPVRRRNHKDGSLHGKSLSLNNFENMLKSQTIKPIVLKDIIQDSKFLSNNLN